MRSCVRAAKILVVFLILGFNIQVKGSDQGADDLKVLRAELMVANTEAKAVSQVQYLIRKYRGSKLEPDLQFRLAELYMRQAKTDRFLKINRQSDLGIQFVPAQVKNAKPKAHISNAIKIYEMIEKKWSRFERMDEVLYNHAFARQQLGHDKTAEALFERMIAKFPGSRLIPDAHLAVGEMNFRRRQFKSALAHFEAIKSFPDSMVYPYGLYKGAWTHYNLRDADAGLIELEAVIKYGRFVRDQGIDSRLDLRKEALMDMALFFEDVYPAKKAFSYFEAQADELDVAPVILRLSSLYKRHSRHEDNQTILSDFIKKRSTSAHVPIAYIEIMEASDKLKKHKEVVAHLRALTATCDAKSHWSKGQGVGPITEKDSPLFDMASEMGPQATPSLVCDAIFQKTALSYANKWLKIYQKDPTQKTYADVTEAAFEVYLQKDPRTEISAKARFVYAELLFKRGKFRAASDNFHIAGGITTNTIMAHDAQYFAILNLEKAVGDKWSDKDEERFLELADVYLTKQQKPKYELDVRFKRALIAYEKSRYDEAAPQFLKIGEDFATNDKGLKAQDLYLDILNVQKKYEQLKAYSYQLRQKTKNSGRISKLTKLYEQSYFMTIQKSEENKDHKSAIEGYKAFAKENPKSPLAKEALWNALQLHFKIGDLVGGAESAVAYADVFKLDSKAKDALMKAAQTYEGMGQLRSAADVLVRLSRLDTTQAGRWKVLAADFYFLSDEYNTASKLYTELLGDADKDRSFRALTQLHQISKRTSPVAEQENWLRKIASRQREPEASEANLYFLEALWAKKDYAKAFVAAKEIVGNKGASPKARASARLIQARILAKEYREQSLKTRFERLELVLKIKTEKLGKAQEAFQSATSYGDPKVAVLALKELGDLYLDYSKSLKNMPLPSGVPAEEEALFRSEMSKLALPMEERGYETKTLAFREAQSFGLRDGTLSELQGELDMINQQGGRQPLVSVEPASVVLPVAEGVGT